jgi:hypothetical protein
MAIETMEEIMDKASVGYVPKAARADEGRKADAVRQDADKKTVSGFEVMTELIKEVGTSTTMSPLERIVKLRKVAKLAEAMEDPLIRQANIEFAGMKAMEPNSKAFAVGGGEVKIYTKPAKYEYPVNVKELEIQFKAAKTTAVANGTAIDVSGPVDPAKDRTFAISV